jgi:hypothetical protein
MITVFDERQLENLVCTHSVFKMETSGFSEIYAPIYQTTYSQIPENRIFFIITENLKSRTENFLNQRNEYQLKKTSLQCC